MKNYFSKIFLYSTLLLISALITYIYVMGDFDEQIAPVENNIEENNNINLDREDQFINNSSNDSNVKNIEDENKQLKDNVILDTYKINETQLVTNQKNLGLDGGKYIDYIEFLGEINQLDLLIKSNETQDVIDKIEELHNYEFSKDKDSEFKKLKVLVLVNNSIKSEKIFPNSKYLSWINRIITIEKTDRDRKNKNYTQLNDIMTSVKKYYFSKNFIKNYFLNNDEAI